MEFYVHMTALACSTLSTARPAVGRRNVKRLQAVTRAGVVACIAAAAAASAPNPAGSQGLAASSLLLCAALVALHKLEEQFVYAGPYDHSKK